VDGVFVGSGIFKSERPEQMAQAIVKATTHYNEPKILAEISRGLGEFMPGLDVRTMPEEEQLAVRGW
jgi:pyridoxal 5'-phosphate synthase pdxS subunit